MPQQLQDRVVDTSLFLIANLVNVLLIGIFLSRPFGLKGLERALGVVLIALAAPVLLGVILNAVASRGLWFVVLPALLVAFLLVELLLDYVLRFDFRATRWLWPYLAMYYLSLMGMIGYSFLVGKAYGFITLATYFLNLLATWYSYSRVGHGN